MNAETKPKRRRGWLRWLALVAAAFILLVGGLGLAFQWGWFDAPVRNLVVARLSQLTGGQVELTGFHFNLFTLRADLKGLTIHGREPAGTPPLFHADSLIVGIQVDSFWGKKVSLRDVRAVRPDIHLRFNADGSSNLPILKPPKPDSLPLRERLFEFAIHHLELDDGTLLYNDVRVPLVAQGDNFNFALDWGQTPAGAPLYAGKLSWQDFTLVARRYLPAASDLSLKFSLTPDALQVDQLNFKLAHSSFDVQASIPSLAQPAVSFRYRGWLDLADIRVFLRKAQTPGGLVDFGGEGSFSSGEWRSTGHYAARDIGMEFQWFHSGGISSRGTYRIARGQLVVPDFEAHALDGAVNGQVSLKFKGLSFRADSHATGMKLATVLAAVDNPSFPIKPLHWDGIVQVDAVTTWSADFKHLESSGTSLWTAPADQIPGMVPATANLNYDYVTDRHMVTIRSSQIDTPAGRINMDGTLASEDSLLNVTADFRDLLPWNDFINRIRGLDAQPVTITGSATWLGRITGPITGPTFTGHTHIHDARYGSLYWDEVEGEIAYSPDGFKLSQAHASRGQSSAQIELALELDEWSFSQDAKWSFDADLARTPTDGLQQMFGWSYPVHGLLSGQFHMRGTHSSPQLTGLFDLAEVNAWGWTLDRARGGLTLDHTEVRITNADIRLTPLSGAHSPGILTGNFGYRFADANIGFDLTGAVIPIENIQSLQTPRLPLGGQLSFELRGGGPILAPTAQGTIRLVDFRAGSEVLGSFEGKVDADGKRLRLDLSSALPEDRLRGSVEIGFSGGFPITGELDTHAMDLDSLIEAGLHLEALTGHSSMDGHIKLTGALLHPETLTVDANFSRIALDYEYVKLENNGPVQITYRRSEVRVEQAALRGTGSDFKLSGFARFAGDRSIGLNILGTVNLQLLGGFINSLDARGSANVNTDLEGTLDAPRINGRFEVKDVSVNYDEFPAGLSKVSGAFIFDATRLLFDNVHAETGGGQMQLSGSLSYGDGFNAMRYDISARASSVRIRYPEGMSWLASGTLRFAGNLQSAQLSGNVTVGRVLMSQGFDLVTLIGGSNAPVRAPSTSSPFMRNLQFDILADSAPDARVEWNGARFDSEANLRVRGTWENPVLLGHIALRNGELMFSGNRYTVTRGDIDFSNPFRLDPILNIQATTTISQYEITLDLSGPASRLTLSYRSDPPLPTSDIVNLLALGQATESTQYLGGTASQSPQMGATTLLSEAVSNQLGGRMEKLFGISSFRVDPFLVAGGGTEQSAATRVTVEQQVSHNLTITYSSNVTGSSEQVIQIEYNVRPDISIVALRDLNGTFSLAVEFKKRFK
jgi:translocation and assembly module TamB